MRPLAASVLVMVLSSPAAAQTARDDGLRALAAGDYSRAVEILRPLAESTNPPDHTTAFMMALLYASGRGISRNDIAACGLFAAASQTRGPFAEQAANLAAALRNEMGRAAEFCAGDAWRALAGPTNIPGRPQGPASAAGPGLIAAARGDMTEAVRVTRPAGESDLVEDPLAQFFVATAYHYGGAVPRDDLRACALYARAANDQQSPVGELSSRLMRTLWQAHDNEWFAKCQVLANLGFDNRFEPATFGFGLGFDVSWDFDAATVTYQGSIKRFPMSYAPRGAAYLPLVHTELPAGRARARRDFVSMLYWEPKGGQWSLTWHLFEVASGDIRRVAGAADLAVRPQRPPPDDTMDPSTMVAVRLNQSGMAEWAVLDPAHAASGTIESLEDLRAARADEDARQVALARVDWSRTFDPFRAPALRYASDGGCANFQLVGLSGDRGEALVVRVDTRALALTTAPAIIDVARESANLSIVVHVADRPLQESAFCTDAGQPLTEETWRAVSGRLTVELSARGADVRRPSLYRATIRLDGAEFVNRSGRRARQTAPIILSALVGFVFG